MTVDSSSFSSDCDARCDVFSSFSSSSWDRSSDILEITSPISSVTAINISSVDFRCDVTVMSCQAGSWRRSKSPLKVRAILCTTSRSTKTINWKPRVCNVIVRVNNTTFYFSKNGRYQLSLFNDIKKL